MVVVAKLKAKSGKEKEMEDALREMVGKVKDEEGTLAYTLHRFKKDPSLFLLYEKYKDKDALNYHGSTPHFKKLFENLATLIDGEADIGFYDEIASL